MNWKRMAARVSVALLACGMTVAARADDAFPGKMIKMINPYAAGGGSDVLARVLARDMSAYLKQPIIIENRPGASGLIGANAVRTAPPDGYTLLFTSSSALVGALVKAPQPFDPFQDFAPVARAVEYPLYMVINPEIPARNLRELATYAKNRAQPIFHTSVGIGSTGHLGCELFALAAGIPLSYVPYTSVPAALQSVMTNQTQLMCDSVGGAQAYVTQGKLRGLAIMGKSRMPQVPDVPTTAEAGFPGVEAGVWLGLLAPKGTPASVVQRLNEAMNLALRNPEMIERAKVQGLTIIHETPGQADAAIKADLKQWAEIVRIKQIRLTD
ncbi:MAG: tripartite tricarboxylate transporter substrate binding protein [Alcaligenaceae bacterium]|nr:tripartite tricarboxylate transporter substrate binding protein [Alcaligenaceae bacterium SAGV5]MPS51136.1 tripartite tricarboxylate transporter substrate binding protein [Alcaligenaceae bacterium SAGV3]MPT59474.1 tripartite tricarboxylate transporter substrate binding protein [Alcaligenaceae bacterium]